MVTSHLYQNTSPTFRLYNKLLYIDVSINGNINISKFIIQTESRNLKTPSYNECLNWISRIHLFYWQCKLQETIIRLFLNLWVHLYVLFIYSNLKYNLNHSLIVSKLHVHVVHIGKHEIAWTLNPIQKNFVGKSICNRECIGFFQVSINCQMTALVQMNFHICTLTLWLSTLHAKNPEVRRRWFKVVQIS